MAATSAELPWQWNPGRRQLSAGDPGWVMGIINATPDSFSDGGRYVDLESALAHAERLITDGADILDIGGESTRPGARAVSGEEERERTEGLIRALRQGHPDLVISIDTSKASVAEAALDAGADLVNDVTGLCGDPAMLPLCVERDCGVVIMHMQGTPQDMQEAPVYEDVVTEVRAFFQSQLERCEQAGMDLSRLIFDPGIGFGKSHEHNLALLRGLDQLEPGAFPLLLGISRKSFIGRCLGDMDLGLRDWPSVALTAWARQHGVLVHRVHEVAPHRQALDMMAAVLG